MISGIPHRSGSGSSRSDDPFDTDPETGSVNSGGGKEVISTRRSHINEMDGETVTRRDHGFQHTKDLIYEEIANNQFPLEQSESIIRKLQKRADEKVRQTYVDGRPISEVDDNAIVLHVGLTFMAGADAPQVNRVEQIGMANERPDQKDANWRVLTAGSLLNEFKVDTDLSIVMTDQTPRVIEKARRRKRIPTFASERHHGTSNVLTKVNKEDRTVTIDSELVDIVSDLTTGQWDIESTLIEVDGSSLTNLIVNYKHLIYRDGPALTFGENNKLLETMIEDTRRLCARSPILFRMSTRVHIIKSTNTRYGIDHGMMFQTLTTSKGIKEIISLSASYFNSLDAYKGIDHARSQKLLKPRFLQMITLLLSLLNDDDLNDIGEFLESTYNLRAERQHVELLILKVLPMMSINSKIFIKAMVTAFEGLQIAKKINLSEPSQHRQIWDAFLNRILVQGYFLAGDVTQLGRSKLSWAVKWPEDGFKSSSDVFKNLQYNGGQKLAGGANDMARAMNEIPPIVLHLETSLNEVAVTLNNGERFQISPLDLEKVTCMVQGQYSVVEARPGGRTFDLEISELRVNSTLYDAIRTVNQVIRATNSYIAGPRKKSVFGKLRGDKEEMAFKEVKGSGRLTVNEATLNSQLLAITYKVNGQRITKRDLIRHMTSDINLLNSVVTELESQVSDFNFRRPAGFGFEAKERIYELKQALATVKGLIGQARSSKLKVDRDYQELKDEPIEKVFFPQGDERLAKNDIWYDYHTWLSGELLYIDARRFYIGEVTWLSNEIIELKFQTPPPTTTGNPQDPNAPVSPPPQSPGLKLIVTPLQPVEEGEREDEVRPKDGVLLVGQYVIVLEPWDTQSKGETMANCLRIIGVEEATKTRRGMNRRGQESTFMRSAIC